MNGNKKILALAVLCAVASVGFVLPASAEETMQHDLDEVIVEADRDALPGGLVRTTARLGILGDKSILDIPYSEMSMTQKTLSLFDDPSQPLANVLQNNPSIRSSTSSPMYTDFSMRGVNMNGNHMMLNGIPSLFYQFTTPPSHIIDRIDITSGPNAGVNGVNMSNNGTDGGTTPAPGTINIITKKALDTPITRYTQTFSGRSNLGEYIDIGRRFGKNNEYGLRVNAEYMDGGLSLPGTEKNEKNIFFNLDHKGEKSTTNLFAGHFDLRVNGGQRWFTFGGSSSSLPGAPNSKMNYDFPETTKWVHGYLMTLNHEQKMDDDWSWFANFGQSRRSGNKYNSNASLKFDDAGNFVNTNRANAQNEAGRNVYAQLVLKGKFSTGTVKHNVSLAFDRSYAKYWNDSNNGGYNFIGGNIYDGVIHQPGLYPLPEMRYAKPSWEETNVGITIADSLEFGKAQLFLAASRKHENFVNLINGQKIVNNNILPTYGLTYKPTEQLAIYAGHTESFSRGSVVTNGTKDYVNDGETLDPVKSKQNEIGVKYQNAGILTTFSYFDIDQANMIDVEVDTGKNLYRRAADGKNRYKGLELTVNGKLAEKWTITGGLMYLDAEREKTQNGASDGLFVNGVAKWSSVIGLEYTPDKDWGIVGRAVWNDNAFIDNTAAAGGKTEIPSYVTFDAGIHYKTKINTVPVKLSAMCYNVTNKDYWMGRGGSTTFGLSMPRTFMVSAQFDL